MPRKSPCLLHSFIILIIGILLWVIGNIVISNQKRRYSRAKETFISSQTSETFFAKILFIDQLLKNEYIDPEVLSGTQEQRKENALKAYVAGIDDPYTNYLSKEENTQLVQSLRDETGIEGIGAVIEKKDTYVQIEEIIKNWPAYKAGLLPLDKIIFIETWSTQDLDVNEAVAKIRGEKGTEVRLFIQREEKDKSRKEFWISITRNSIEIPSVLATLIKEQGKNIWHFEISSISEHTTKLFISELLTFINQGMEGMILDLRGNGGGYLEEASKFLGHFLPKGEPTVQSEYQAYESMTFKSDGKGELANLPTVILIDQLTASAGEIIALTLQEQGVPLIGMPSFGKGSIQTFTELPDGSSLKYTVGKRYSPQHVSINGTGVIPNIEIQWDYETYQASGTDNQLEKAKEELLKIISSRPVGQDSNQLSHNRRFLSAHII